MKKVIGMLLFVFSGVGFSNTADGQVVVRETRVVRPVYRPPVVVQRTVVRPVAPPAVYLPPVSHTYYGYGRRRVYYPYVMPYRRPTIQRTVIYR
jgi:hypothetical protein